MLTAHLPSGYVLGRVIPKAVGHVMPVALVGAVIPDLDMIWFHLVDNGAIHHHRYWVHVPAFWIVVACVALPVAWRFGRLSLAFVFFAAILMHLLLDTISGGILWGVPFSDHLFTLVTVPADYSHWIISFVLHWTFAAELVVWAAALSLWLTRHRSA